MGDHGWDYHVTPEMSEHFSQDYEDGAALRRLREALPDGGVLKAFSPGKDSEDDEYAEDWGVAVVSGDISARLFVSEFRPTIAEAADKCREALKGED